MAYLKQSLPDNQETLVLISSRLGQEEGKFGPQFKYQVTWGGQSFDHAASLTEEKALQNYKPGDEALVIKKPNKYGTMSLYWQKPNASNVSPGIPSPAAPANPSPPKCKAEWKFCECDRCEVRKFEDEARWAKDKIAVTLAMYVKANMNSGMDSDAALAAAEKQRTKFIATVEKIAAAENAGVDLSTVDSLPF